MLSRVADSLFWMSRYMERVDGILRMLKTNYAQAQDDLTEFSWRDVLQIFTYLSKEEIERVEYDSRAVLSFMVADRENPNSVWTMLSLARENARGVQDHITKEMWQCINDYYHFMRSNNIDQFLRTEDPVSVLDHLIRQAMLYFGTTDVTMSRGDGNSFINIGKFLERSVQSADILDVSFAGRAPDATYLKYLLISLSGFQLYLKTYRSGFEPDNVIDQIILNEKFPRSIIYSTTQLNRYFNRLKTDRINPAFGEVNFMIGKVESFVRFNTVESIEQMGLHNFLAETKRSMFEIGNALSKGYFAYT